MARHKDENWCLPEGKAKPGYPGVTTHAWDSIQTALLMDLRDELKRMNSILYCANFLAIPRKLERIARNTEKKRKAKT